MENQNSLRLLLFIVVLFPIAFVLMWSMVSLLISWISGWGRLAKHYRTEQTPVGMSLNHYWLVMGPASYRGVATLLAAPEGLYLSIMILFRLGHPRLLIPWSDIRRQPNSQKLFYNLLTLELGNPKITTLRMPTSDKSEQLLATYLASKTPNPLSSK